MTDIKGFLTGEGTDTDRKIYADRLGKVNADLTAALPQLRALFTSIKDGKSTELEVRSVQLGLPAIYWETFEKVIDLFKMRNEFDIKDENDVADIIQDNVSKVYSEKTSLNLGEVLMSQFMLDTVIGFAIHVARAQILEKVQRAMESGDPDVLMKLITNIQEEGLNEPDDSDDDPEN